MHRAVLALLNKLRSEGMIASRQTSTNPRRQKVGPRWMEREIGKAQFVLMICTEAYYLRVMGQKKPGVGLGIAWEGTLIYNHIYNARSLN